MEWIQNILGGDIKEGLLVVLNLIIIESLLSVDNAAVLATMVLDLPPDQRKRALRYGIVGSYVLRIGCLFIASQLIKIWWLKSAGGLYLVYLATDYFLKKLKKNDEGEAGKKKSESWLFRSTVGVFGTFWATVALIELMDLAFSIDNIFAVVAFTNNFYLICIGVFIGILAMRFVAQAFVKLMEKFTFLESIAFTLIGFLGLKLLATIYTHFFPEAAAAKALDSEAADMVTSIFTISIFLLPVLSSLLFNFPKRNSTRAKVAEDAERVLNDQA